MAILLPRQAHGPDLRLLAYSLALGPADFLGGGAFAQCPADPNLHRAPMESLTNERRRELLGKFCSRIEDGKGLLPAPEPLPYNPVPAIETAAWPVPFIDQMVSGELSEATNLLHQWLRSLRHWNVWNELLQAEDSDFRWAAEWEWVEPLAFHCLFQPSATRDRFTLLATNALHQVRMAIDPTIKDELLGDPSAPGKRAVYPSRRAKESQLTAFANPFPAGKAFMQALRQLDDGTYRKGTVDFRNRASHGFAPRISVGITSMVTRERVQATTLERQADGRFLNVLVPDKMATSYGFGGIGPLVMESTWKANCQQFARARGLFEAYIALLQEAIAAMPASSKAAVPALAPESA
jgi:hypothetical protein